jgi:ABC-type antimicrobial peptide transport system ATPase subunit
VTVLAVVPVPHCPDLFFSNFFLQKADTTNRITERIVRKVFLDLKQALIPFYSVTVTLKPPQRLCLSGSSEQKDKLIFETMTVRVKSSYNRTEISATYEISKFISILDGIVF